MALLAACAGDDDSGSGTGDGSVGGTYDIDKEYGFDTGSFEITGTIMLPTALQAGRGIQLNILKVSPSPPGNSLDFAFLGGTKNTVTYRARNLVDGTWRICLRADADGNSMLNDTGIDYTGCYDGTVAAPMKDPFTATEIVLGGANKAGIDFGLGLYP